MANMKMKPVTSRRGPKATPTSVKFLAYDGLVSLPRELIERALDRDDNPIDFDVDKIQVQVFTDAKKRFVYVVPFFEGGAKPSSVEASIFRVWKPKRNAHTVYFSSLALFTALDVRADKLPARYEAKVSNGMIKIDTSRGRKVLPRKARQ